MKIQFEKPFSTGFLFALGILIAAAVWNALNRQTTPQDPPIRVEFAPALTEPQYAPATGAET